MLAPELRQELLERLDAPARPARCRRGRSSNSSSISSWRRARSRTPSAGGPASISPSRLSRAPRRSLCAPSPAGPASPRTSPMLSCDAATGTRSRSWSQTAAPAFRPKAAAVADLAWRDAGLRGAFVQRSDLPGAIVDKLWPSLHSGFKARVIASGFRYSMSEVEEVGRETSAALRRRGPLGRPAAEHRHLRGAGPRPADRDRRGARRDHQNGRLVEAAQLIARCLGLGEGVALNLLYGV